MPYIRMATSKDLTMAQKEEFKSGLAEIIGLIPGKTEAALMVEVDDGLTMFFQGEKRDLAYLDAKFSGDTEFEHKKQFTEAVFALTQKVCTLPQDAVYLTYSVFSEWGTGGTLKAR
jgi:hypothetical protein